MIYSVRRARTFSGPPFAWAATAWVLAAVACAETTLDVPAQDPANPATTTAPLPAAPATLASGFDPDETGPDTPAPPAGHHHQHQHHSGAMPGMPGMAGDAGAP